MKNNFCRFSFWHTHPMGLSLSLSLSLFIQIAQKCVGKDCYSCRSRSSIMETSILGAVSEEEDSEIGPSAFSPGPPRPAAQ